MLLAELTIRHTRRHMPTRRVALDGSYLPMSGSAHGETLLAAVVCAHLREVDDEQTELLLSLIENARDGLAIPRVALRHRLQRDTHGLDRSRHRVVGEHGRIVVELDMHAAASPQVLGSVLAAASLPPSARSVALSVVRRVVTGRFPGLAAGVEIRYLWDGVGVAAPPLAGSAYRPGRPPEEQRWLGVPSEQRWAMEVLGLRAGMLIAHGDVNRRFRRLLRDAHPDHGAAVRGAAERISELAEARGILLTVASAEVAARD